jgi:phosphatidylglycerophosphatase C
MNLALFDFDGTITRTDTWTEFLRFSASRRRLIVASVVLSPLIVAYRLGFISARKARPIVARVAFRGRDAAQLREVARVYVRERLPPMIRQRALERIDWHKRQGDDVVVVSGSLDVYLSHWCSSIGVDLICTELEEKNGKLTGRYVSGDCSGDAKVRRIRERLDLDRYSVIYAYGDTDEDREMLHLAAERYYRWKKIESLPQRDERIDRAHPDRAE